MYFKIKKIKFWTKLNFEIIIIVKSVHNNYLISDWKAYWRLSFCFRFPIRCYTLCGCPTIRKDFALKSANTSLIVQHRIFCLLNNHITDRPNLFIARTRTNTYREPICIIIWDLQLPRHIEHRHHKTTTTKWISVDATFVMCRLQFNSIVVYSSQIQFSPLYVDGSSIGAAMWWCLAHLYVGFIAMCYCDKCANMSSLEIDWVCFCLYI